MASQASTQIPPRILTLTLTLTLNGGFLPASSQAGIETACLCHFSEEAMHAAVVAANEHESSMTENWETVLWSVAVDMSSMIERQGHEFKACTL